MRSIRYGLPQPRTRAGGGQDGALGRIVPFQVSVPVITKPVAHRRVARRTMLLDAAISTAISVPVTVKRF